MTNPILEFVAGVQATVDDMVAAPRDGREVLPGFAVKLADVLGEPPAKN